MIIAAYAVAITHEIVNGILSSTKVWERYSEMKKTRCPKSITRPISATALLLIYLSVKEKMTPKKLHNAIPHRIIQANCQIPVKKLTAVNHPWRSVATTTRKSAIAVPSLKRLSHSNMRRSLLGTQRFLNSEMTATGSVALMMIHRSSVISRGIVYHTTPLTRHTHTHMSPAHRLIHTMASHRIGK